MKYCGNCGTPEPNDAENFCKNCGKPFDSVSPYQQQPYNNNQMPMNWFKFLIYFALFAGAVMNFLSGIGYLTGLVYDVQQTGMAKAIYFTFPSLKIIDILFGLMFIALAAFQVYTRFRLAQYRSNGPMCLLGVYAALVGIGLFYAIIASSITGINVFTSMISSIIVSIAMMIVNYIYFKKRAHMFTN